MRYINGHIIIAVLALAFLPTVIWAADWGNFDPISLLSIASQAQTRESSATITLLTTTDAQISADNTPSGPAELSCATDTLVTEYKLTFDSVGGTTGVGTGEDGGTEWQLYSDFLTTGTEGDVTYIAEDNDVDVTLWVKVSNNADELADSDTYNATQTLTVSWIDP